MNLPKNGKWRHGTAVMTALLLGFTLFLMTACGTSTAQTLGTTLATTTGTSKTAGTTAITTATPGITQTSTISVSEVNYSQDDLDPRWSASSASSITLNGQSVTVSGTGATATGSIVTITSAGTYVISGKLSDGQLIVNTESEENVRIVLNGAEITCATSAPVYIVKARKVILILADGTQNTLTDGTKYTYASADETEPNATLFSKADLMINGTGTLTVKANYNDGIASKDELKIVSGTLVIQSAGDGIRGRDFIAVKDGLITIQSTGDGLKSTNDVDAAKGDIAISGGTLKITSGGDGIQGETRVWVGGGSLSILSGGGSTARMGETGSAKGIKATVDLTIDGGTIDINASDDALHSNDSLTVNAGTLKLASGDDGVHADASLEINGGDINLVKSDEGLESSVITINDGKIAVVSSDDGINGSGGTDGSSVNGRPGQNSFSAANAFLFIHGGYIYVDAGGDGIDVNGPIEMSGGVVIVNGPTDNDDGALDYTGTFNISGGFLVAAGSSGMAEAPSASSTQYTVMVNFTSTQAAGSLVSIQDASGGNILTFAPAKTYQSVVLCSSGLKSGATCQVYAGGNSTGTATSGLYTGGTYKAGTSVTSLTLSGIVTTFGSTGMGGPGGRR